MASVSYKKFLKDVQTKSKEDITRKYDRRELVKEATEEKDQIEELIDHLERKDAIAVWKRIANAKEKGFSLKEMKDLSVCQKIYEYEEWKGKKTICNWLTYLCNRKMFMKLFQCPHIPCNKPTTQHERKPALASMPASAKEKNERRWLTILSDPLYIGIKWLWSSESEREDVIASALHNAYIFEELAKYEHHYSRNHYLIQATRCENFACDVVEQGGSHDLHKIMDTDGTGPLVFEDKDSSSSVKARNYIASLRFLKFAAEKGRKKFVSSPGCQYILNEIVYQDPRWQDRNIAVKMLWAVFVQLLLAVVLSLVYVPYELVRVCMEKTCCKKSNLTSSRGCENDSFSFVKDVFEHPYSKFINHTTWYLAFLILVIVSTFTRNFETTSTGFSVRDWIIMAFVIGFIVLEIAESWRQGCFVYFSKWWNVVDTLILATFFVSYVVWVIGWILHGEWKPRSGWFISGDILYACASVMAYFHLLHVFQVNSTLGPLQLSLYKMLKDVLKFLLIFVLLYAAFSTGLVKIYTYYAASQNKIRNENDGHYNDSSHPYAKHVNTFLALFWLLIGTLSASDMEVKDPAFTATQEFGRIFVSFYIIFMVIVALSMLVAMMNNSFDRIMENADIEWKFSRTQMWLEWIGKGSYIPSPLSGIWIPLCVLYVFIFCIFQLPCLFCKDENGSSDNSNAKSRDLKEKEEKNDSSVIIENCPETVRTISEVDPQVISASSTGGEGSSETLEDKSYKQERMETMKELVVSYLVEYLKKNNASKAENGNFLET